MKIETITNNNIDCILNGLEIPSYNLTLERIKPVQPSIIDSTVKELALRHAAYLLYQSLKEKRRALRFIDANNSFCNDILYFNNFDGIKDNKNDITINGIFLHQNRFIIVATVNDTEEELYYCMW